MNIPYFSESINDVANDDFSDNSYMQKENKINVSKGSLKGMDQRKKYLSKFILTS